MLNSTMATPSLRRLSPSTRVSSRPGTPSSRKTATTATGSVAEIRAPKTSAGGEREVEPVADGHADQRGGDAEGDDGQRQDGSEVAEEGADREAEHGLEDEDREEQEDEHLLEALARQLLLEREGAAERRGDEPDGGEHHREREADPPGEQAEHDGPREEQ
jgi:hypothetical protein